MNVALELQPCYWARSGIGTYVYEIARRLHDGDSLTFHGNVFDFRGREGGEAALAGIEMPVQKNRLLPYGAYRRLWNYLPIRYSWMFPQPADVTIFFNFIVPPRVDGKVMSVVHDLTYIRFPETMKASNLTHLQRGMKYSLERSDRVIAVSEFTKRELHELLGVPKEKISVVYNAPSLASDSADYGEICKKFGIRGEYILFVGTIEPRKNISRLLQAFEMLKGEHKLPHQLVLAGGKGWQDEQIFQTLQNTRFADDIVRTGYVSAEEKNALYQNASVFVFPSVYEGFGIPPLEAMTWGCPVVCANAASLPEVVGDAAELVDPMDESSIADGILRVLTDHEYAQQLIEKGRAQARKFSWDRSAEQLFAVCKEVLEQ